MSAAAEGGAGFCCEPVGYVRRPTPVPMEWPRGREVVIDYNERIMREPAVIELLPHYCSAAEGLARGSLVWVIWYAHLAPSGGKAPLRVHPYMDAGLPEVGVFATRSPARPCPIGLTLAVVAERSGCRLVVYGLDAFDGTPVLDIKAYSEGLDSPEEALKRAPIKGPQGGGASS